MTIRKMWLFIFISAAALSVGLNSIVLSSLTGRYFKDYLSKSYETHLEQIIEYTEDVLSSEDVSYKQMTMELEIHLIDPIIEIKLYSPEGDLLVEVQDEPQKVGNNMSGMMRNMMNHDPKETLQYHVSREGEIIGILSITTQSLAENSYVARRFKSSLLFNSLIAFIFVLVHLIIIGLLVSKKMSKSLLDTAKMATGLQQGIHFDIAPTNVHEINVIRDSIIDLDVRLRLKQKSRKKLIDGLVHQTRTPLTILKSHIEAIDDGVIDLTSSELSICQDQINNLTNIISNMSAMIDANKEVDELNVETVNISSLIKQIGLGLTAQFHSKSISLDLKLDDNVKIQTDRYKLSQSLFNLLVNSYNYTNTNGHVEVAMMVKGGNLLIEVKDNGLGIEQKEIDKIYAVVSPRSSKSQEEFMLSVHIPYLRRATIFISSSMVCTKTELIV